VLRVLDAAAIRRWTDISVDLLDACRAELNRINVFPVADSDTGTNLLLTVRAAADALARRLPECQDDPVAAAAALAVGALRGARGNSGVIVSQLFRGLADAMADSCLPDGCRRAGADARTLAVALARADELARAAVSRPVEGTVLTVLRGAASCAENAANRAETTLAEVVEAAGRGARVALADTPRQLPALARAGVLDAGGYGLVLLLDALAVVVTGRPASGPLPAPTAGVVGMREQLRGRDRDALVGEREGGSIEHEYEVMYLLTESSPERVSRLRERLDGLGDSVAIVGSGGSDSASHCASHCAFHCASHCASHYENDEIWHVHVHCTDVGAAIEAGIMAGRPRRVTVVRFIDQVGEADHAEKGRFSRARAVVTVAKSESVAELLSADGVAVLMTSGQRPPGVARLAAAVAGTRARHVVLLPNDVELNIVAEEAAEQARAAGQEAVVVPTSSVLQGLAALAVHDPTRRAGDDVVSMAEAAAVTRTGVVQVAEAEALTWVGRCHAGDVLGLVDGEVVLINHDIAETARQLVDRMLHIGGELVTVLLGIDAPDGIGELLERHLNRTHPEVDVVLYRGGPAGQPVALGVE